jgi:signal transduction histidine kinase
VGWRADLSGAWQPLHRAERNGLLLTSLRWCLAVGFFGIALWGIQILIDGAAAKGRGHLLAYAVVCIGVWIATTRPAAARRARLLALAYILVLTGGVGALLLELPDGPVIASAVLVSMTLGATLLLPWGAAPQAVVGAGAVAVYGWLHWSAPQPPNLAGLVLVLLAAAVALAGAHLLAAYRARLFEHTWQKEQLVALTRDLVSQTEPAEVMRRLVEHGRRLMASDTAVVAEYEPHQRLHRIGAAAPAGDRVARLVGLEFASDFPLLARTLELELLRIPEDDAETPLVRTLLERGLRRGLFVSMRSGETLVGALGFVRRADVPFSAGEQRLARGIADQAALALRNARLVADLRQASVLKSQFVSTVSHELRTPLNVILGFSEMGRDPDLDDGARQDCFAHIESAGRELLTLIESTLDIGRIDAGVDGVRPEPVALPGFWSELQASSALLPRADGVVLEWGAAPPPLTVVTDPRKLAVVMRNLLGNALKFTERGRVRIEMLAEGGTLVLRVADTGIGIRPQDRETIFEMFRQADGSDTRRYGGTGLGLYIARRFTEQLGGTVTLESKLGEGSTFTIRLPLVLASPQVASAA